MRIARSCIAIGFLLLVQNYLSAQDKLAIKFGKITPADFDLSHSQYDTGAAAVIIADIGKTTFEGNKRGKGDFSLLFTRFKRIKIINKSAFDVADQSFPVYADGEDEESLAEIKASTYNLENGNVVETKLDSKSIFTDKMSKHRSKKKFTMPAVKAGCIIEIMYTIRSDFYTHLRPWNFQGEYPVLWSEYEVHVPVIFKYVLMTQGDQNFHVKASNTESAYYSIRKSAGTEGDDIIRLDTHDLVYRWVKKDVPPMKYESYTTTIDNYVSRVEFQLQYIQITESSERIEYMRDWYKASERLLNSEYFGAALNKDNHWMEGELKSITAGAQDDLSKAKKIYAYVRDHFSCTDHDELYADKPLKTVFASKNGSVAEINLLLVAMLRHENIESDPMILSTRDNGLPSDVYPLVNRFNYVICASKIDKKPFYLDASWPLLGFNQLPEECYNGMARTINKDVPFVANFDADSLLEQKRTAVIIINDEKGQPSGSIETQLGQFESYSIRKDIKKSSEKEYFKDIQTSFGSDMKIENTGIDSMSQLEYPLKLHYDFNFANIGQEDIIYFNPMLTDKIRNNPFKAISRKYPVEMPYAFDYLYTFSMEVPEGYTVDEIPKSAKVVYNESQGLFEYLIQKNATGIQMRCRFKLNNANFPPDEYNTLRDFYGFVVEKMSEQIVFKKKK
jgi:Domain of Unknown Function with PDB structure (DUF3857)/Transglutaminase-like superfamily